MPSFGHTDTDPAPAAPPVEAAHDVVQQMPVKSAPPVPKQPVRTLLSVTLEGADAVLAERLASTITQSGGIAGLAEVFTGLARSGYRGKVTAKVGDAELVWGG